MTEITVTKMMVILSFAVAVGIAALVTPLAIRLAPKIGAMDVPKDGRRMHDHAMPRFGGLAIYVGSMVPILFWLHSDPRIRAAALGGTLVYLFGITDDLNNLNAKLKFGLETLIAILMYAMGLRIRFISTFFFGDGNWQFGEGLCFVVTVLWIVGITNTINLVDGLDGLAAGVASIAAVSIAYVAYIHGDTYGMTVVCLAMVCLAGGAVGFLPYNFYPSKIFMGDGGSLYLGFMLASLSVVGPLKQSTLVAIIVPVAVLGIPIFDTFFAIVRRLVNHRPIMEADKGHLHHRLIRSGYGQRRAVLMIYGISGIMGMTAILISRNLYKDAFALFCIAVLYVYVFLTDPNHKLPMMKAVDVKAEEERQEKAAKHPKTDKE